MISDLFKLLLENQFIPVIFWLLGFVALLGLSFALKSWLKLSLASSLLITILGALNILYWATFINYHLAQFVIIITGLLFLFIKRRDILAVRDSVLILMAFALWFGAISSGANPFSWDEFFWTLFDQHINQYSSYWTTTSAVLTTHIRYMPGSSLWHNFFSIPRYYQESTAYFANSIFFFAILYWLVELVRKENRLFVGIVLFLAMGCFSEGWYIIYVDHFLGLLMGLCLVSSLRFFSGKSDALPIFILSLSSCLIFKETGSIPLIALVATLAITYLFRPRQEVKLRNVWIGIGYCFAIIFSWKFYLTSIGIGEVLSSGLFANFTESAKAHYVKVIVAFSKSILTHQTMLVLWAVLFMSFRDLRKKIGAKPSIIYISFTVLAFFAIHLISWLFLTTNNDGENLAAFPRYMGSLLVGAFVFYVTTLGSEQVISKKMKFFLCFLLLWVPLNSLRQGIRNLPLFTLFTPHPILTATVSEQLNDLRSRIPPHVYSLCKANPSTKIWFVYQNSNGWEAMLSRHILTPCQVSHGAWSLGSPYYAGDIWTGNFSTETFLELAKEYHWMMAARIDEQFIERYGQFFVTAPKSGTFYSFDEGQKKFLEFQK